jgi:hypothetical protein
MLDIHFTLTVSVPQLETLGAQLMDALQSIKDAIVAQSDAIVAELQQLAQQAVIDPADVQALADQIVANTEAIKSFVPDAPPPTP